jgi:hypothetical protein
LVSASAFSQAGAHKVSSSIALCAIKNDLFLGNAIIKEIIISGNLTAAPLDLSHFQTEGNCLK